MGLVSRSSAMLRMPSVVTGARRSLTKEELADYKEFNASTRIAGRGSGGGSDVATETDRMIERQPDGSYKLMWQMGSGGRKLPVLPKGTKVGDLVMGEFGLHHPKRKAEQDFLMSRQHIEVYQQGGPADKFVYGVTIAIVAFSLINSLNILRYLQTGKDIFGVADKKK